MNDLDRVAMNAAPWLAPADFDSVIEAMKEGLLGRGPQGIQFEQELRAYLGAQEVVTVGSGTVALQLALMTVGVRPGDEVVVPSFTFCASIQAILAIQARPVFIDNAPGSLALDPDDVLRSVTPRTRAIMPVHYGGRHINLDHILPELRRREISVVDDAAHAFGSVRGDGRPFTGRDSWVCFSFDAIKTITCAEGGAIVPPREASGEVPRLLRALGVDRENADIRRGDYVVRMHGVRAHLAELNAALGRSQLVRIAAIAEGRRRVWRAYRERIEAIPGVRIYDLDVDRSVPFNCAVTVDVDVRDDLVQALRSRGVGVGRHYPANHLQPAFKEYADRPLPNAEWAGAAVITLPFGPDMTVRQVDIVCGAVAVELGKLAGDSGRSRPRVA
ncbi:DegT/DnrJ/EryC1/StrS family aminotransferase [Naumannella cuiyingiana]|uniref:dTDP-4-amino-4,6-dideoxygalactose transaminase n=1 Tax=Naumannella cuiyingiana TaxID=1347891 RepID=A0A7Z0D831_9ACTN|nr:DegT/DnrJ/EryC1/StrS family aminotransferase [Naumannella cuiyingiana]NYI70494.1 dTDP-4-amino-4,6-dideoxygalactose transaminase [Naumannella cuiyingiana]